MKWLILAVASLLMAAPPSLAIEPPAKFVLHETPAALADVPFEDGEGQSYRLADFRGKVVLLNLWATWCAPCRHEMPTLDRLQAKLGNSDFQVIALSIDRKGPEAVRSFYAEIGIKQLGLWIDSSGKAARTLGAVGLPTTILIDRAGQDIGRLIGPAEWDTPEMITFFKEIIAAQDGIARSAPPGQ